MMTEPVISQLGLPGIVDVHTHFMAASVLTKVQAVFDRVPSEYGTPWPIQYRDGEQERLDTLRGLGVCAFTALAYAHKPGMAVWLNSWATEFADKTPDCLRSATFFPEPDVLDYTTAAIDDGTQVFKVHLMVGGFDPRAAELDGVWGLLAEAEVPVIVHCGSGPKAGSFTGPGPIGEVIARHPRLSMIVAHLGSPEYGEFLDMAAAYPNVRLDTTMALTDFMERLAPFPAAKRGQLREAGLAGDVFFGSDFPNIPYEYGVAIDALVRIDLGDDWLRAVLHDSAASLFTVRGRASRAG